MNRNIYNKLQNGIWLGLVLVCLLSPVWMVRLKVLIVCDLMNLSNMVALEGRMLLVGVLAGVLSAVILLKAVKAPPQVLFGASILLFLCWMMIQNSFAASLFFGWASVSMILLIPSMKPFLQQYFFKSECLY